MITLKGAFKYLPTIGIFAFFGIYIIAAKLYPGGSIADIDSTGFDWRSNHWCNLMRENAINGVENQDRSLAITGITILCISMIVFFFQFANHFEKTRHWKLIIKISGALAMISATFIFTKYHNVMTTILSISGSLVIIGMIRALHNNHLNFFKVMGVLCIFIIALNNFFYFNEALTRYSPVIQKIAFVLILSWTIGLNAIMNRKKGSQLSP
ncbi:hypothetical protein [Robertkochia sediminum]|uniref:hypothetical protein n=1 Tax=Robertkochia sediminum TaxID=2785326 RepID=UPI001932756D|nr:hypothetical protein [Robertkochia sediminum]MBL7471581.1 hypothetical protein [Robertkochia sediminum]